MRGDAHSQCGAKTRAGTACQSRPIREAAVERTSVDVAKVATSGRATNNVTATLKICEHSFPPSRLYSPAVCLRSCNSGNVPYHDMRPINRTRTRQSRREISATRAHLISVRGFLSPKAQTSRLESTRPCGVPGRKARDCRDESAL